MSEQLPLDWNPPDSTTLHPVHDEPRLATLNGLVLEALESGGWMTLGEIREAVGRGSEAGISARIRDLHNKFGKEYEKRRRGAPGDGLWEYRLVDATKEAQGVGGWCAASIRDSI